MNNKSAQYFKSRRNNDAFQVELLKLNFSLDLEKRRKDQGVSYKQLAEKVGVSAPYISKVFKGDVNVTIETMYKVAKALDGQVHISISNLHKPEEDNLGE